MEKINSRFVHNQEPSGPIPGLPRMSKFNLAPAMIQEAGDSERQNAVDPDEAYTEIENKVSTFQVTKSTSGSVCNLNEDGTMEESMTLRDSETEENNNGNNGSDQPGGDIVSKAMDYVKNLEFDQDHWKEYVVVAGFTLILRKMMN